MANGLTDPPPTGYQPEVYEYDPGTGQPRRIDKYVPPLSPGRDMLSGLPWWVRAVALVGVPTIISLWLVSITTGNLALNVTANGARMDALASAARIHDERVTQRFESLQRSADTQTRLLRSICQSVARSDIQRERCTE